jgi:hypothetical protein
MREDSGTSGSVEDLQRFAAAWALDFEALADAETWPRYAVIRTDGSEFSGRIGALHVIAVGRFGNRFYQLLNAAMIARRLGCSEIRVDGDFDFLPCRNRGIEFLHAGDPAPTRQTLLRGVYFSYRGFDRLIEPLDAWFIRDTIHHLVAPFFISSPRDLGANVMVLQFRSGDVFSGEGGWVPPHYVMPPAGFYTHAFEFARERFGVTEARIVYEDRGNPAIAAVEHYFESRNISFRSTSGSLDEDAATLQSARHLAIPYGSFGEANALLSQRIETLFSFRCTESHQWMYQRTESLLDVTLRQTRNVRIFVTDDRGGYIPPFGWKGTAEQVALIRDYPAERLEIREVR